MSNLPSSRPQKKKKEVLALIKSLYPEVKLPDFFIVGIRGYYQDSMGEVGKNDRNMYDDAIFLIGKEDFLAFNGNTDPAAFKKAIAVLKPGFYPAYKFDLHKGQYIALCQRATYVTVIRDQVGEDTGMFGINIHKGGNWGTSSLGCQTIPPEQWQEFIDQALILGRKYYGKGYRNVVYTYILMENIQQATALQQPLGAVAEGN